MVRRCNNNLVSQTNSLSPIWIMEGLQWNSIHQRMKQGLMNLVFLYQKLHQLPNLDLGFLENKSNMKKRGKVKKCLKNRKWKNIDKFTRAERKVFLELLGALLH